MSAKAIREATGKDILNRLLDSTSGAARCNFAAVNSETNWDELLANNPWLATSVSINTVIFRLIPPKMDEGPSDGSLDPDWMSRSS